MSDHPLPPSTGADRPESGQRFRLVRYFTATGLAAFLIVGAALLAFEYQESRFFRKVQQEQADRTKQAQRDYAALTDAAARRELLTVHETGHVGLARVLANAMWGPRFAPLVARAGEMPFDACRTLPDKNEGNAGSPRAACFAELGGRIRALDGFAEADAGVVASTRGTTVFKIKVFDLRGITVYSSEHAQVGEDKTDNQGWRLAAAGQAATEITHRDRFSAFERVVENRDLISSYVPVRSPDGERIVGVFEIYSDVTPFLNQIRGASERIADLAAENQEAMGQIAAANQRSLDRSSVVLLVVIGGLLSLLYGILLLLARRAQRILDAQAAAHDRSVEREQQWHREKMAALATMAANVAHETNNPLAAIAMLTDELGASAPGQQASVDLIREQVDRIAQMTRRIADFAASRSEQAEPVDVNRTVQAIADFLGFDERLRGVRIQVRPGTGLPAPVIVPDHLTEIVMNLVEASAGDAANRAGPASGIGIETGARDGAAEIRIVPDALAPAREVTGPSIESDRRVLAARHRIAQMGATLTCTKGGFIVTLPVRFDAQPPP
jgi:signal transduction histidine kinase